MVEGTADSATIADDDDTTPEAQAGVGRAVVLAALVSAFVLVVLVEVIRQLMVHSDRVPAGVQPALFLALLFLPGVGAGLVGNVRGCGLGTAVGAIVGGLWVLYRLLLTPPSKMDLVGERQHFFGAYLVWMFGGAEPEEFGWMNFANGTDELRQGFWTLIVVSAITNVLAATCTAALVRQIRRRNAAFEHGHG